MLELVFKDLSWQGRNNLTDSLQMELALAIYRVRDNAGPLQVETLRFLQKAVDEAYTDGKKEYDAGKLKTYLLYFVPATITWS